MCSQARMYEINYIESGAAVKQSHDKNSCGQLAFGSRHPPLPLQKYKYTDRIDCLYREGGVCEKIGPVVKWAGRYY